MNQTPYSPIETPLILVDDDAAFAAEFAEYLDAHGFRVTRLTSLSGIEEHLLAMQPALLVLDQFLGRVDSLTMLPRIKTRFNGGVVVLTGNHSEMDRIIGLELGADDFIPKSQPPREILARLHAVMRRVYAQPGVTWGQLAEPRGVAVLPPVAPALAIAPPRPAAAAGGWRVDTHRRELLAPDGTAVDLTGAEFDLLAYLHAREGDIVSRDVLSEVVLRRKFLSTDRAIDNLVARIRAKVRPFLGEATVIKSVRAAGYVFVGFTTGG